MVDKETRNLFETVFKSIREFEAWKNIRDGRDSVMIESERQWKKNMDNKITKLAARVSAMEIKVVFASGFVGCVGAVLGALAVYLKTKG